MKWTCITVLKICFAVLLVSFWNYFSGQQDLWRKTFPKNSRSKPSACVQDMLSALSLHTDFLSAWCWHWTPLLTVQHTFRVSRFKRLHKLSDALPKPFKHFLPGRRYQACPFYWVCPVTSSGMKRDEYLKLTITCQAHHNGDIKRGSCKRKIATGLKMITLTV